MPHLTRQQRQRRNRHRANLRRRLRGQLLGLAREAAREFVAIEDALLRSRRPRDIIALRMITAALGLPSRYLK
jgi:hypothetical protein